MKQNKKYRALKRLIGKITKSNAPLNNSFSYYNYTVGQYSGTCDYTDVTIVDFKGCTECSFSFDFQTKELNFENYKTVDIRNAIIEAFKEYYEGVKLSITDELLDEEMLKQLEDLKKERNNL